MSQPLAWHHQFWTKCQAQSAPPRLRARLLAGDLNCWRHEPRLRSYRDLPARRGFESLACQAVQTVLPAPPRRKRAIERNQGRPLPGEAARQAVPNSLATQAAELLETHLPVKKDRQSPLGRGSADQRQQASLGLVALQNDSMHAAALPVIVIDCEMLGRAIVPDSDRTRLPTEPASKLRPRDVSR